METPGFIDEMMPAMIVEPVEVNLNRKKLMPAVNEVLIRTWTGNIVGVHPDDFDQPMPQTSLTVTIDGVQLRNWKIVGCNIFDSSSMSAILARKFTNPALPELVPPRYGFVLAFCPFPGSWQISQAIVRVQTEMVPNAPFLAAQELLDKAPFKGLK